MINYSIDYLEFCLNVCLVLFFQKFGFVYKNFTHFVDENKLEDFLGNNQEKEFYLATTKRKNKWYFLRPEMTYVSLLNSNNLQNIMYCSSGFCFRYERKQFCRFKEFMQFDVEFLHLNESKIRYISYYLIILTYYFLNVFSSLKFLQENIILDLFYNNKKEQDELMFVSEYLKQIFQLSEINVSPIERQGNGITPYSGITFEYHVKHDGFGV